MTSSLFDHPYMSGLFADEATSAEWSADAQLPRLIAFERALTVALTAVGDVSAEDGGKALAAMDAFTPDIADLRAGVAKDGLVVPALVRQLRAACEAPKAIHTGSTSQDLLDTVLVQTLEAIRALHTRRLGDVIAGIGALAGRFGDAPLMGRTRMQAALPITAAHRLATWRAPLERLSREGEALATDLAVLQFGGPVGDRSSFSDKADQIAAHMAATLGLRDDGCWHTDRGLIVRFGNWSAQITGALGKIGADLCLMAQQGVDEVKIAGGGSSSAMAHKANPILAELLVTLAHYNAAQTAALNTTLAHEQERSGAMWALEWMVLPPMTVAAGRALSAAVEVLGRVERIG